MTLTRIEMIEKLISDDIDTIRHALENNDEHYLKNILMFSLGYDRKTIKEVTSEYESRGFPAYND
jgi:hypothetical protein